MTPPQNHPAAPHLANLANYDRKRRNEKEAARLLAEQRRDRSAASRDIHEPSRDPLRSPPHITRVSASVAAPPSRKLSEPVLNGRPEVKGVAVCISFCLNDFFSRSFFLVL